MSDDDNKVIPFKGGKCPICGRPVLPKFRPFCSRRCTDVDLSRWMKGNYRVPGSTLYGNSPEDEDDGPPPETTDEPSGEPGKKR